MRYEYVFKGVIPSKKNSKMIVFNKGKVRAIPSQRHKVWHDTEAWLIPKVVTPINPDKIDIKFWMPDRKRRDISNAIESIFDLLVDMKIIEDDNCFIISDYHPKMMGIDKNNPRCELTIDY